eukprot:1501702-Pyramimonas_sp.AAC.1
MPRPEHLSLAESIHGLPLVAYADSCTLVHYDIGVDPGCPYFEAEGTALNIYDITGSAPSRITQRLTSTKLQTGFDQDMT